MVFITVDIFCIMEYREMYSWGEELLPSHYIILGFRLLGLALQLESFKEVEQFKPAVG